MPCIGSIPTARSLRSQPTSFAQTASRCTDGRRLYVAASNLPVRLVRNPLGPAQDRFGLKLGGVVVYDLDGDGNISNGRVFFRTDEFVTDGMTMDTDGNLYVALHNGNQEPPRGQIVVLNPAGEVLVRIAPAEGMRPGNLGLGAGPMPAHST